jgi:hypothetical protein
VPRLQATEVSPGRFLPLLSLTLTIDQVEVGGFGVVDSGADMTMLPDTAVEACGLDYDDIPGTAQVGEGAGSQFEFKLCDGSLKYDGKELCQQFAVAAPKHHLRWALLGRKEFFTKYVVRFAWHRTPPDFNVDPVK